MSDELFSVAGQVVLVSGASRGIGRAIAAGFAERGAKVIITGREQETLTATADEIAGPAGPVDTVVCDVASLPDIEQLIPTVMGRHGRIDTLVNVAGVNLRGLYFLSQAVGKTMIERQQGSIINIDSLNTYAPLKGVLPYAISKAGVSMMTRGMASEWGPHGVRVNALAPGFILTDMTNKLWSIPKMQEWGYANTPLRRLGKTEDMIGTVIYLASKASEFMTGQVLYVDGGMSAGLQWPIDLA